MTGTGSPHDFAYVHSDIPEGMTIRAWRAQCVADNIARATDAYAARHHRRTRHMRKWLVALLTPLLRPRRHSREAER